MKRGVDSAYSTLARSDQTAETVALVALRVIVRMKRICVFCGSRTGVQEAYRQAAVNLGRLLAERGWGLVFGGGRIGLMGIVADRVMQQGGEAIGVIPKMLMQKEIAHSGLTSLRVVCTMHERKAMMAELADGFIALPGGYGTLEEFFEILTWAQLGLHRKPCGLLNVQGYFDPLLGLVEHAVNEGFVRPDHRPLIIDDQDAEQLLDRMVAYTPPETPQLLHPGEI